MLSAFRKIVRGVIAAALTTTCTLVASGADESIFRYPSLLDDPHPNQAAPQTAPKRPDRSFRLVQFDDAAQGSPSDIRRVQPQPPKRPTPPAASSPIPGKSLIIEPSVDPTFADETYCCESASGYQCEDFGSWLDNSELLFAADVYKSIGDSDGTNSLNNSFGVKGGANTSVGLGSAPVRMQIGGSYGAYDLKGRDTPVAFDSSLEQQVFVTFGLYKRSDISCGSRYSYGMVIDEFLAQRWGTLAQSLDIAQLRGQVGYAVDEANEIGAWCAVSLDRETATTVSSQGTLEQIQGMDQFNLFWHRNWVSGGDTTLYGGIIENADLGDWVVGATGRAPLSSKTALYGGFAYCGPHSGTGTFGALEESWNVSFGVLFYPGCKAFNENVSGQKNMPLMPVANNGTFLITPR